MIFECQPHDLSVTNNIVLDPRPSYLFIYLFRARTRRCDDASTYSFFSFLFSFFRGRRPSMQSLAKMCIFLKMPSFTLFTADLIRDTS